MRLRASLAAVLFCGTMPITSLVAQAGGASAPRPTLLVFLTVDQMRSDYLDRWSAQYTGGLARFRNGGAIFSNAFHDHAITETAPGHSVTMAGRLPRSTGIVSNTTGVFDPQSPLLTSRDAPASPYRFRGSVLMDWLRARDARSRGLSISRKDRGAIFPMGRAKQSVFWFAGTNGEFTTSRYYADTLPTWIRRVNARRVPQRTAGRVWDLLLPAHAYAEPDSVPFERNGTAFTFPHVAQGDSARAAGDLPYTPWMDEHTLQAALEGVTALALGAGPAPDILAISLSASDYIGHTYGPDSREQHDNFLRLDRSLGTFIDSLYKLRDSTRIVFALTSDHGVTSFPELVAKRARRPVPPRYDVRPAVRALRGALRRAGVDTMAIRLDGAALYVERDAFKGTGVDPDDLVRPLVAALRALPGIARVERVADLASRDSVRDAVARRWLHMLPADVPIEWFFVPRQGAYPAEASIAMHGAPHDDDAHVPVMFYGPWFKPGRYGERAQVADMAPTLARVLGVPPTERLDGRVLTQALADARHP